MRTALSQTLVILVRTFPVRVGTQFDRYVRVIVQHLDHLVQSFLGFRTKGRFIEIVENVIDNNRLADRREKEIHDIRLVFLLGAGMQLVILVEVTTGAGHHDITDVPFQLDTIGTVFLDRDFHVQSVFSDDAYGSVLDRIFIDIVYDSFDEDGDRRPFKGIYMVIAPCVVAVGAEEASFLFSGEGDTEIVCHRVDGSA